MKSAPEAVAGVSRRSLLQAAIFGGAAALLATGCESGQAPKPHEKTTSPAARRSGEIFAAQPSWQQDFRRMPDGPLDTRYWNFNKGYTIPSYNHEAETLTARSNNVRVQDGRLILEARKQELHGHHYTSAHVNTQGKFSFQYGKLEVDIKAPAGIGTWPAAWLLPEGAKYNPQNYGIDPTSNNAWAINGEIDFFETVGAEPHRLYPDFHSYNSVVANQNSSYYKQVPDMYRAFNTYGVELTPGRIAFTLNGEVYHHVERTAAAAHDPRKWPFDQPYYLILNLAMGGSWGGEDKQQYPPDGIEGDGPWEMQMAGVRFYDYTGA